jgi:hypothetical protein
MDINLKPRRGLAIILFLSRTIKKFASPSAKPTNHRKNSTGIWDNLEGSRRLPEQNCEMVTLVTGARLNDVNIRIDS